VSPVGSASLHLNSLLGCRVLDLSGEHLQELIEVGDGFRIDVGVFGTQASGAPDGTDSS
jgi:hypothetical protein